MDTPNPEDSKIAQDEGFLIRTRVNTALQSEKGERENKTMLCSIEGTLLWLLLFTFQCTQASSIIAYYLNINKVDKKPWTGDRSSLLPVVTTTHGVGGVGELQSV